MSASSISAARSSFIMMMVTMMMGWVMMSIVPSSSCWAFSPPTTTTSSVYRLSQGSPTQYAIHHHQQQRSPKQPATTLVLSMGLFDGISKAFANEDFKSQDRRVRASHILIKGDDYDVVFDKIKSLYGELQTRANGDESVIPQIFADLARRESSCDSKSVGGDLGIFGPGKMVQEFDDVLFPEDIQQEPPVGAIVGPVITDFGAHLILVTKRESDNNQVEEKLARIDPDAAL